MRVLIQPKIDWNGETKFMQLTPYSRDKALMMMVVVIVMCVCVVSKMWRMLTLGYQCSTNKKRNIDVANLLDVQI